MDGASGQLHEDHLSLKDAENPLTSNQAEDSQQGSPKNKVASTESSRSPEKSQGSPPVSPEPNCAICLEKLENKSFTDSCFHMFCFKCLLEWSKVKAECPLCKQPFKSIIHNVRSIEEYDQYYINSRLSENTWQSPDGRRFRYPSTLTVDRRRHLALEQSLEYQNYRSGFAPHSVHSNVHGDSGFEHPYTSSFRRRIYENGLWVRQNRSIRRYRDTSPEFFLQNPACTHRLIPWLNRELVALLYNSENQVTFVLELILGLIMRYDIRSQEFYLLIHPYLQDRTSHFIHEFFNFARSPNDLTVYDSLCEYDQLESQINNQTLLQSESFSSMLSAFLENSPSQSTSLCSPSQDISFLNRNLYRSQPDNAASNAQTSHKKFSKIVLRRTEKSVWKAVQSSSHQIDTSSISSQSRSPIEVQDSNSFNYDIFGPSTSHSSRVGPSTPHSSRSISALQNKSIITCIDDSDVNSNDSDCVVVDYVMPKYRSPEIVDLVSDDDQPIPVSPQPSTSKTSSKRLRHSSDRSYSSYSFADKSSKNSDRDHGKKHSSSRKHSSRKSRDVFSSDSSSNSSKHHRFRRSRSPHKRKKYALNKQKRKENKHGVYFTGSSDDEHLTSTTTTSTTNNGVRVKICSVIRKSSSSRKNNTDDRNNYSHKKHKEKKRKHKKHKHHKHKRYSSDSD